MILWLVSGLYLVVFAVAKAHDDAMLQGVSLALAVFFGLVAAAADDRGSLR